MGFDGEVATLTVDGTEIGIPFEEVHKANRIYSFTRADFDGSAGRATG